MTERRATPMTTYVQSVATAISIAAMIWVGTTLEQLRVDVAKIYVMVQTQDRRITTLEDRVDKLEMRR